MTFKHVFLAKGLLILLLAIGLGQVRAHEFRAKGADFSGSEPYLVKDIWPGEEWSAPSDFAAMAGLLFFAAQDGSETTLWKSDGTAAGTDLAKDILPGNFFSNPESLTAMNDTLFFAADDGVYGLEFWQSDGTEVGTVMVKDLNPGPAFSLPYYLAPADHTLFFSAEDGPHGRELWAYFVGSRSYLPVVQR